MADKAHESCADGVRQAVQCLAKCYAPGVAALVVNAIRSRFACSDPFPTCYRGCRNSATPTATLAALLSLAIPAANGVLDLRNDRQHAPQ